MNQEKIQIREMQPEDLPEVCRIEKQTFSMPWSEKGFLDSLKAENTCYLTVLSEGEVVGYCGLMKVLEEGDITNVAVKETCRGRGVGYAMLEKLLEKGKSQGIEAFTLEVRESNASAIGLYEKLGFVNCGVRKNYYENPVENAVIMWKR